MNINKYFSIIFILILTSHLTQGQHVEYIALDTSVITGVKFIEGSARENAQFIRVINFGIQKRYTPEELSEYGFRNGTVYESREISISGKSGKAFLNRMEAGKIKLYYYTEEGIKTFFVEYDSTGLKEIRQEDYRKKLLELTSDMGWKAEQTKLVRYDKKSIAKLIHLYNDGENKPMPFRRIGLTAGYSSTNLRIPSDLDTALFNDINFSRSSSLSVGLFADLPIEMGYYSFNTGVIFSQSGFSANSSDYQGGTKVVVNMTSMNIPFLVRYTFPSLTWRPFINVGGSYSRHFGIETEVYETIQIRKTLEVREVKTDRLISESMVGFSAGIGLQRHLTFRRIISAEVRMNQWPGSKEVFRKNQLEILFSLSL
jgi:hypothetical protein